MLITGSTVALTIRVEVTVGMSARVGDAIGVVASGSTDKGRGIAVGVIIDKPETTGVILGALAVIGTGVPVTDVNVGNSTGAPGMVEQALNAVAKAKQTARNMAALVFRGARGALSILTYFPMFRRFLRIMARDLPIS